ncbi:MAG: acetyl-CoA carboxylase, biotin carboxyl carrier protein [Ruminococcus sp.]|nr:acetyl-CoA carboxylase, biotin carboxyl carrier protein [Ruminococcus sp.]
MGKNLFDFELDNIKELAEIVAENKLEEITLGDGEKIITVRGRACPPPPHHGRPPEGMPPEGMPPMGPPPQGAPQGMPPMGVPQGAPQGAPAQATPAAPNAPSGNVVKAPIVGTFYSAPSPDDSPFVTVGKTVAKGDVIFIVESMKVMSEVTSDFDGVVKEILVKNGDPIEYDQPIMIIE